MKTPVVRINTTKKERKLIQVITLKKIERNARKRNGKERKEKTFLSSFAACVETFKGNTHATHGLIA